MNLLNSKSSKWCVCVFVCRWTSRDSSKRATRKVIVENRKQSLQKFNPVRREKSIKTTRKRTPEKIVAVSVRNELAKSSNLRRTPLAICRDLQWSATICSDPKGSALISSDLRRPKDDRRLFEINCFLIFARISPHIFTDYLSDSINEFFDSEPFDTEPPDNESLNQRDSQFENLNQSLNHEPLKFSV